MLKMPKIKTSNNAPMALAYVITLSKALSRSAFLACTFLLILGFNILFPFYKDSRPEEVSATTTTENLTPGDTSISITADSSIVLPIIPNSSYGTFNSNTSTVSVTATNPGGYTLSLATRSTDTNNDTDNTSLVNNDDGTNKFVSISENITTTAFSQDNSTGAALNGKWGYLFYKSGSTGADLTTFKPSPSTGSTASLDASGVQGTTNYTLGIGARAGLDLPAGTYSNTFVLTATANPISYTFNLKLNDGTANNFYTQVGSTYGTIASIYATAPVRDGYEFKGWCSTTTSDDTCSGTTYQPGAEYAIDTSTAASTADFYAMWKQSLPYMQDVLEWGSTLVNAGDTTQAVDNRDGKKYWVTRLKDGKLWMTQNLDLDIGGKDQNGNDIVLTSENTNLKVVDSNAYSTANGYSQDTSTGVITWIPVRNTIDATNVTDNKIAGWADDNNTPYSVNPGNWYWDSNTFYASTECIYLNGCTTKFRKNTPYSGNGEHGHVGNYYNWTAAIATNNSSSYSSSTLSNINNNPQNSICPKGWRLPTMSNANNTAVGSTNEFGRLNKLYNYNGSTDTSQGLESSPLYFVRGGRIFSGSLKGSGSVGGYLSSTIYDSQKIYRAYFAGSSVIFSSSGNDYRYFSQSVRCVAEADGTMQGFTSEDFSNMAVGESERLMDTRSDTTYEVKMLTLNNTKTLWMMSNLKLQKTASITPDNSNVTSTYTALSSSGNWISSSQNDYCAPYMAVSGGEYYYNWPAATARTNSSNTSSCPNDASNSVGDICPKGWRLPTTTETGNSTWRTNIATSGGLATTGNFFAGSPSGVGSYGGWWTSTQYNDRSAYDLFFYGSSAFSYDDNKYGGRSVRCLRTS